MAADDPPADPLPKSHGVRPAHAAPRSRAPDPVAEMALVGPDWTVLKEGFLKKSKQLRLRKGGEGRDAAVALATSLTRTSKGPRL